MDLESQRRSVTSEMVGSDVHNMLATSYTQDIGGILRWRQRWKKIGDAFEAIAKGFTGVSAVLAFAASAVDNTNTANILSFTSGTVGTVGLVLLTYSTYATKESRQRTAELNALLTSIGVTPVPHIAATEAVDSE